MTTQPSLEQLIAERIAAAAMRLAERIAAERYSRDAYSVKEAAERLGINADTVRMLIDRGDLHAVQTSPGGRVLIPAWSIARWLGQPQEV